MTRTLLLLSFLGVVACLVTLVDMAFSSEARVVFTDAVVLEVEHSLEGTLVTAEAQGAEATFLCPLALPTATTALAAKLCPHIEPRMILDLVGQPSAVDADVPAIKLLEIRATLGQALPPSAGDAPDGDGRG